MINWFSYFFKPRISLAERRRYPRTKTSNLVKFFDPRVSSEVQIYNMADISAGGLQLRCPERFRINQSLNLLINLSEKNQEIAVLGRVTWSAASSGEHNYRVGVHFSAIGEDDRKKIRDYVQWIKRRVRFALFSSVLSAFFPV